MSEGENPFLSNGSGREKGVEIEASRSDIKIPISELRVGMFITKLDRDWLDTPFKLQGFFVRTQEEIEKVSEYCRYVYILNTKKIHFGKSIDFESGVLIGRKPEKYIDQCSLGESFAAIPKVEQKIRRFSKTMLAGIENNKTPSLFDAKQVVNDCVQSVVRHPGAAAFITRLRGEDDYTAEHCMNVCMLAIVFGRKLGLKKQQLINLGLCGLLHDVGKAKVPKEILNKPGRLTAEEFETMKLHVQYGVDMLSKEKNMYQGAIDVALSHHEKPDGTGYPRGLTDTELSLFTKIISIVDVYDAITGDRVYAKGRPSSEALKILFDEAGKQFDYMLTLAFIQTMGIYPPGTFVQLINGCVAVVVDNASGPKHLPDILIVLDRDKQKIEPYFVSLVQTIDGGRLDPEFQIHQMLPDGVYGLKLRDFYDQGIFEQFDRKEN